MSITRDNYESWFLDYLEGNLDKSGMKEVRLFLINHPDLAEELDACSPALQANTVLLYPMKEQLKKLSFDDPELFEDYAIAHMEGDLGPAETKQFEIWLADKDEQRQFLHELECCKLSPDLTINFPEKGNLKKKATIVPIWSRVVAIAAILFLAFLVFYPRSKEEKRISNLSAETISSPKDQSSNTTSPVPPATKAVAKIRTALKTKIDANVSRSIRGTVIQVEKPVGTRVTDPIEILQPRCNTVSTFELAFADLVLPKQVEPSNPFYIPAGDLSLADYFKHKLQFLKANTPNEFITREEVKIAGLRLFSRLPGNRLTGKKGSDGRLRSITFNTQLLAFSIPVNRQL